MQWDTIFPFTFSLSNSLWQVERGEAERKAVLRTPLSNHFLRWAVTQLTKGLQGMLKCHTTGEHSAVKLTGPSSTRCSWSHDQFSNINPSVWTIQIQVIQSILNSIDKGPWQVITVFTEWPPCTRDIEEANLLNLPLRIIHSSWFSQKASHTT